MHPGKDPENSLMVDLERATFAAFCGEKRLAMGPIEEVALAVKAWQEQGGEAVLVFDDRTGRQIDLDLRGSDAEALARLAEHPYLNQQDPQAEKRTGPGRPKLGVTSREVSLLPRHWDWLNEQPGGASATLRKLVEDRMKASRGKDRARKAHEAASRFAWTMGGNLPHYEEIARAMTRKDQARFAELIAAWPEDIANHLERLFSKAVQADQEA